MMTIYDDGGGEESLDPTKAQDLDAFVRSLKSAEPDDMPCAECRSQMPAIFEFDRRHVKMPEEYAAAAHHLATCPHCAEEYAVLRSTMVELEAGTLPELESAPAFDLSFIEAESGPRELWITDLTGHVSHLFNEINVTLKAGIAAFGSLPAPLTLEHATGRTFRSDDSGREIEVLVLPAPEADLSINLAVTGQTEGKAAIAVKMLDLETANPLSDRRVTLRNAERNLLAGAVTGGDGSAVFEQLAGGKYLVQVQHKERLWEIALVIVNGVQTQSATIEAPGDHG